MSCSLSTPCPCSLSRNRLQSLCGQTAADRCSCADALVFLLLQSVQEQVKQEEAFALLAASMRAELADDPEAGDRIPAQSHHHALHFVKTDPSEHPQALDTLAQIGSMPAALPSTSATEMSRGASRLQTLPVLMQSHGESPGVSLCSLKARHMRQPASV